MAPTLTDAVVTEAETSADAGRSDPPRRPRTVLGRPRFAGTTGALLFLWASFWPTLMPRSFVTQGAMSGISAVIGYAVFTLFGWLVGLALERYDVTIDARTRRIAWTVLGGVAAIVVLAGGLWMCVRWQDQQRAMLGMDGLGWWFGVPMLVVAAIVALLLGIIGRLVGRGVVRLHAVLGRALSPSLAAVATVVVVVLVARFLFTDVAFASFRDWANSAFSTVDDGTEEGIEPPDAATVSGSADSLVSWESLGLQGRTFVATATTTDLISEFQASIGNEDVAVVAPIRAYAGINSADDIEERADLAVAELERTGAFERDVLVVATVTGTGWIDPDAARALELLHGGDTAIVAMQYSFLPSWIATLLVDDASAEAGAVLFDSVYEVWETLPTDERPKLIVYGLSLGSYGAEAAFAGQTAENSVANMRARTDGVLLGGPTNDNPAHREITDVREAGSPVWRPVFDGAETVRFFNDVAELIPLDPDWDAPRFAYVQHASDPVVFWNVDSIWSPSAWTDQPRGPDVPEGGPWVPFVTGIQGVFDLMAGFGAPPGHGHDYRLAWPGAWAQVIPPDGWTAEDTEALNEFTAQQRAEVAADPSDSPGG
jgi:uncharacterized membrane protein